MQLPLVLFLATFSIGAPVKIPIPSFLSDCFGCTSALQRQDSIALRHEQLKKAAASFSLAGESVAATRPAEQHIASALQTQPHSQWPLQLASPFASPSAQNPVNAELVSLENLSANPIKGQSSLRRA